jgi:hypothetical protein
LRELKTLRRRFAEHTNRKFVRLVNQFNPDVVLCTHFLPLEVLGGVRSRNGARQPFVVCVVTDFEAHALWMEPVVDLYCVAADETKARLVARQVDQEKVAVTGIPIGARFSGLIDGRAVRRRPHAEAATQHEHDGEIIAEPEPSFPLARPVVLQRAAITAPIQTPQHRAAAAAAAASPIRPDRRFRAAGSAKYSASWRADTRVRFDASSSATSVDRRRPDTVARSPVSIRNRGAFSPIRRRGQPYRRLICNQVGRPVTNLVK